MTQKYTDNDFPDNIFPVTPSPGQMDRKDRMDRLHDKLVAEGYYVRPIMTDDSFSEYSHFIVALDGPYKLHEDKGGRPYDLNGGKGS